jgi:hypothetical protein
MTINLSTTALLKPFMALLLLSRQAASGSNSRFRVKTTRRKELLAKSPSQYSLKLLRKTLMMTCTESLANSDPQCSRKIPKHTTTINSLIHKETIVSAHPPLMMAMLLMPLVPPF